jgi:GNAT superfamily N-acetyltransferase
MSLDGPLGAFTDAVLGKLIELEESESEYIRALGGRVERGIGAILLLHPTLRHPAFNCVLGIDAEGQDATAFVRRIEGTYAAAGLPHQFVVTPLARPPDVAEALTARGYMSASERLWMDLMGTPPTAPGDPRIDVSITQEAALWAKTAATAMDAPGAEPLLHDLAQRTGRAKTHALLLARFGGSPAGVCEVSVDAGVATIRRLGVLPGYRGREVIRGLLHAACETAYAFDAFRTVTRTFPASGSVPLLELHGFAGASLAQDYVREYPEFLLD